MEPTQTNLSDIPDKQNQAPQKNHNVILTIAAVVAFLIAGYYLNIIFLVIIALLLYGAFMAKKSKSSWGKPFLAFILLIFIVGGYWVWQGFSLTFPPPCNFYEIPLELDSRMQYSEITFDTPMFVWKTGTTYGKPNPKCPNMLTDVPFQIRSFDTGDGLTQPGLKFKVIRRAVLVCNGWSCIGNISSEGDNFLLADSIGNQYRIDAEMFREPIARYVDESYGLVSVTKIYHHCNSGDERNLCTSN